MKFTVLPHKFAVIDFRGWRQVFGEEETKKRSNFTLDQYWSYLKEISRLAQELDWAPQEVDLAIWEFDQRLSTKGVDSQWPESS